MGVHGLTPFLRKAYPTVIKNLPERFRGLTGKRIVIDGTLITQRFHYIPDKHPYQHIISWYRFVQDLNEYGVSAICIFDGKQRNQAKARETRRRRDVRELAVRRASIEQDRFARLVRVKKTLNSFEQLQDTERRKVSVLLASDPSFEDAESSALLQNSFLDDDVEPTSLIEPLSPLLQDEPPHDLPGKDLELIDSHPTLPNNALEVAAQIKSSFLGFKANVAKLVTLSIDQPQRSPVDLPCTSPEDEQVEKVMSKSQHGLSVNEHRFWKECITNLTADIPLKVDFDEGEILKSPRDRLETLVDKSSMMVSMYERRTSVPTQETYRQARLILEALGIPCIVVADAHEAEALASSIVLAGHADYVMSEDTDVLVYEAPLIRNMTTRDPFFMISGTDVRQTLQLTRDEYVDFAILLGTDFSERITNVGPVRALNLIKEFGCIENIVDSIENNPKYQLKLPTEVYLAQVNIARSVFKTLPPPPSSSPFDSRVRSEEQVTSILENYGIMHQDISPGVPDWWRHEEALDGNYFNDSPFAP